MIVGIEERVDSLESILGHFLASTGAALNRLEKSQRDLHEEMKDFKDEMKDFKEEMCADRVKMNKQWGELANKMGTVVEDIIAPNIPTIAKEFFAVTDFDYFGIRIRKKHPEKHESRREFDVIAVTERYIFFNETKSTVRQSYLEKFVSEYSCVFEYFPEYKGKILIPIFSSLSFRDEEVVFLTKHRIYAMAMKGEITTLLNFTEIEKL